MKHKKMFVIVSLAIALGLVACNSQNSGNQNPAPVNAPVIPYQSYSMGMGPGIGMMGMPGSACQGYGAMVQPQMNQQGLLYNGMSSGPAGSGVVALNLTVVGDPMRWMQTMSMAPASSPSRVYVGPVSIFGNILLPGSSGFCSLPPGNYNVITCQPSQWTRGVLNAPLLMASNGMIQFMFSMDNGVLYRSGYGGQDRLAGTLRLISVNGANCSQLGASVYLN